MNMSAHHWLRRVGVAFVPGPSSPPLEGAVSRLRASFEKLGHRVTEHADESTDGFVTTARFGEPVHWRDSLFFTGRKRFGLRRKPALYTLVSIRPAELEALVRHFETVLRKDAPAPRDYEFPGLAPNAFEVLFEQGRRGGPMMSVARLVQAQSKSLRVVLLVGEERPGAAYLFDLAGAYPRVELENETDFYDAIALRLVTALSTRELTRHEVREPPVSAAIWESLGVEETMLRASRQLGTRQFFTRKVLVQDLVRVPRITDTIATQYSEGCFATWAPELEGLVTTVTGSSHPVDKGCIARDDLAVVVDLLADRSGTIVRHVEGLGNAPPSSEAVEFKDLDGALPWIQLGAGWNVESRVPVVRSKLHGHRGVTSFDPRFVEFVPLDPPYHDFPVSCSTEAQGWAVTAAFSRSQALNHPDDPRQVVFTVLPCHGTVLVEKWVRGKEPFEVLLEAMDRNHVEIACGVPQGRFHYAPDGEIRSLLASGFLAERPAMQRSRS